MAYPDLPCEECMPNPLLRPRDPLFSFAQFGDAAFQKTRLVAIPEDIGIDLENPEHTDTHETSPSDAMEEYKIDDSDIEEGNADLECLTDYCI